MKGLIFSSKGFWVYHKIINTQNICHMDFKSTILYETIFIKKYVYFCKKRKEKRGKHKNSCNRQQCHALPLWAYDALCWSLIKLEIRDMRLNKRMSRFLKAKSTFFFPQNGQQHALKVKWFSSPLLRCDNTTQTRPLSMSFHQFLEKD